MPFVFTNLASLERGLDWLEELPAATEDALVERRTPDALLVWWHGSEHSPVGFPWTAALVLPGLAPTKSLATLGAALRADDQSPVQDTRAVLRDALEALGVDARTTISTRFGARCAPGLFRTSRLRLASIHTPAQCRADTRVLAA
jgi:hypothetical protein